MAQRLKFIDPNLVFFFLHIVKSVQPEPFLWDPLVPYVHDYWYLRLTKMMEFKKLTGNSMIGHILRDSSSKPPPGEICEETNRCLWVHRRCLDHLDVKGWAGSDGHSLQCFSQVWPSPLQMCRWPSRQEFRPHSEWRIEKQKTTEDRGWSSCPSTLR